MIVDQNQLGSAVEVLSDGGVIAYPTEAVWGLGCDPFNESAVDKILRLKIRSIDKGLILVASDISHFDQLLAPLTEDKISLLESSWPGPTTWLIEDYNQVYPRWIKGKFSSVAVRVSNHQLIKELCDRYQSPIVSTSLNPAGKDPALNINQALAYFADDLDCVIDAQLGESIAPSRILSLDTLQVLR